MTIRTRIAPSPTGNLHLGTAYAALWPYLFVRKNKGKFILRIEDTDQDRSTKEFAENIIQCLSWLELKWDEGPFYQMERLDIYVKYTNELLDKDKAYLCFCTKEELEAQRKNQIKNHLPQIYSGKCRILDKEGVEKKKQNSAYVIRFKIPETRGVIEFEDLIHGKISFDPRLIGDFVIMRQNGFPLYNYAVVIDDLDMKISHVLRGDDHISNTPKQLLLFEAFGSTPPAYAHYPMILNQDRTGNLSKRTGSTGVEWYKLEGYLPEAILNYLALLGWTPPEEQEILSIDEIINKFEIKDMNSAAAAWNESKLDWINGEYIRKLSDEELTDRLQEYLADHPPKEKIAPVTPLIKERIKKLSDFIPLTNFLFENQEYDKKVFDQLKIENKKYALEKVVSILEKMQKPWNNQGFENEFKKLAIDLGISNLDMFQLIRIAISGQLVTPPLFDSINILGEEESIKRVKMAIEFLNKGG